MNEDCDADMVNARKCVDVIAFGISSFRETQESVVRDLLRRGVNFRILTMHPDSPFIFEREKEENGVPGEIENTIRRLVEWADGLNAEHLGGTITVKGYSCMTLGFYWRVDDNLYIGAYWYGIKSQQTVSARFGRGSVFDLYADYFNSLWNNPAVCVPLSKPLPVA